MRPGGHAHGGAFVQPAPFVEALHAMV